jgi:hypothetical protein
MCKIPDMLMMGVVCRLRGEKYSQHGTGSGVKQTGGLEVGNSELHGDEINNACMQVWAEEERDSQMRK